MSPAVEPLWWPLFRRQFAPVAQLDRAPDYESGGQEFESLRARQFLLVSEANLQKLSATEGGKAARVGALHYRIERSEFRKTERHGGRQSRPSERQRSGLKPTSAEHAAPG